MEGQKVLVIILSFLNLIWLGLCALTLINSSEIGIFMLIPVLIGIITFVIVKIVKKFDTWRALKYANLAYFIPAGLLVVLFIFFGMGVTRTAGIAPIDPLSEQCHQFCQNKTQEFTNATRDCIQNCLQNLRNK